MFRYLPNGRIVDQKDVFQRFSLIDWKLRLLVYEIDRFELRYKGSNPNLHMQISLTYRAAEGFKIDADWARDERGLDLPYAN